MSDPNEPAGSASEAVALQKKELRGRMRSLRRALPDRSERSARIVGRLVGLDAVRSARHLLAYDSIPGEVETEALVEWCAVNSVEIAMPEDDDLVADWPDVIVVPGTAFTRRGERLGQGGGWYDRFLPGRRTDAVTIGLGFVEQIVVDLPTEPHDVQLDCIVTDDGAAWRDG